MAGQNTDELILKITLDDGSVVSGFLNVEKKAKETSKKVEDSLSKGLDAVKDGIDEINPRITAVGSRIASALTTPLGLVTASVAGVGLALKGAFDLTLQGEKLNKLDKQFESLSASFGVAGDALKTKFIDSLGGLVDDSDAIQSLNKAFITLGDKVSQLPEVMNIARKATNLFGGDATANFEAINQAIATGSTRQLRALGIIIDSDKAYQNYAKSIGVTKDQLSESGRQQAILNEVLAKGQQKFKDVSAETGGLTSAYQKFKISLTNAGEEIAKSFAQSGGYLEKFFEGLNLLVKNMSGQNELENLQIKINQTKFRIFELQEALDNRKSAEGLNAFLQPFKDSEGVTATVVNNIAGAKKQLEELSAQMSEINRKNRGFIGPMKPEGSSVDSEMLAKSIMQNEKELTDFILQQNQIRTQSKIAQNNIVIQSTTSNATKLELLEQNFALQDVLLEEQKGSQILAIKKKYSDLNLRNSEQEKASLKAIEDSYSQQRLTEEQRRKEELKNLEDQASLQRLSGLDAMSMQVGLILDGFHVASEKFVATEAMAFKQLGDSVFQSIGSRVGSAFTAFGTALKKGENAGQAFNEAMTQQIAQLASQIGNFFIQAGIARVAASYGADATGYAMIAAGAAINIIGGYLGASAADDGSSADTGGGIAANPSQTTEFQQPERVEPGTAVSVVIQGDVLDSDESGSRIVSLINEAFDKKGVVISQGAFA